ncbi:MAG: hypothetical protein ACYTFQ_24000 [Planctomycetota bacterium]|jgi:hypothetical protein
MASEKYTLRGEQGQVGLEQAEATLAALRGIRATLRRMVLDIHAQTIQNRAPAASMPSYADALTQTFYEVGHLVNETAEEALADDPLPPDYTPSV